LEEQGQLAQNGAYIEHTFNLTTPLREHLNPLKLVEAIRSVGAEHCVLSTDFGQAYNPAPVEGMRSMIGTLLQCGCDEKEMELMVKINPAKLLGIH
jgi:hypothetical protein